MRYEKTLTISISDLKNFYKIHNYTAPPKISGEGDKTELIFKSLTDSNENWVLGHKDVLEFLKKERNFKGQIKIVEADTNRGIKLILIQNN